jgi:hypothetical protein
MGVTVVGSIAFDTVTTPFASNERELGGSATYAALAAARLTGARIVGPVGEDFSASHAALLTDGGVDVSEIARVVGGETFSWTGYYEFDLSMAHTVETKLNVFEGWRPRLTKAAAGDDVLFLAAMDPETQLDVRAQWHGGKWAALDTMGYWIEHRRDALIEAIGGEKLAEGLRRGGEAARHADPCGGECADHLAERRVLSSHALEVGHAEVFEPPYALHSLSILSSCRSAARCSSFPTGPASRRRCSATACSHSSRAWSSTR